MNISFSIIICCYNSATRLETTLSHLAKLDYTAEEVEILLIDNASTDGTAAFAQQIWEQLQSPFVLHHIHEGKAGQAHARKTGILAAKKDYILFVDDDNWLASNYLKIANDLLQKDTQIGVLGGKISGVFETPPPAWMNPPKPFKSLIGNLAISTDVHGYGELKAAGEYVFGAGSFYNKSMLQGFLKANITPLLSGRSGEILTSGDDIELCMIARMANQKIYRSEQLHLQHFITSNRLNWEYFHRLYFGFGYSDWILQFYEQVLQRQSFPDIKKDKFAQQIRKKERVYKRYASILKLVPFGKAFEKNKLFLLETYQKGRLEFLEENFEDFDKIWGKIEAYQKKLKENRIK